MFSTARPMPFGLPAPWVRQYDESTQTWIFVNPTTSPPIISHSHPGFAQSVFYDSEDEEDQDSIEEMSDVAESSSSSSSFSSSHAVPVLSYDASEEDTAPFARVSGPRRRRNAGTAAIALLEKLEMEGQVKDRWLRLKRDRGRKEARTIVVSMMFSHSDDDVSHSLLRLKVIQLLMYEEILFFCAS